MRGFSDEEREQIRADLMDAGETLFARFGLAKTTVTELTDEVGIGTSTFYQFFESKEELYLAVLQRVAEDVYHEMRAAGIPEIDDPYRMTIELLNYIVDEIESNPLIRQLIVDDELGRLRSSQSPAEREAERQADIGYIETFVEPFFETGRIWGPDSETVAAAIAAIPYVALHRDDIGEERYSAVRDYIIEAFARGVTATEVK
ncbi:TetR/AcrR family transcriptional regulator [Haloarchaeobius amylolyticus]|uniref:TetR/AcrR family transcriptional regulator n=1 Tax=Haloarchaeobius amylolyticus TaxID=1198296 RepID=UPI00226F7AE3|nr:TetR/AcrR family transcriptional regulator [Haloarchaeobius amylolyticus]